MLKMSKVSIASLISFLLVFAGAGSLALAAGKPANPSGKDGKGAPSSQSNTANSANDNPAKANPNAAKDGKTNGSANANPNSQRKSSETTTVTSTCSSAPSKKSAKLDPCNDYIIIFTPGASAAARSNALTAAGSKVVREFSTVFKGALINGPASKIAALAKNPNVKFLEQDAAVTSTAIDTTPGWGLDRIDQRTLPLSSTFNDSDKNARGVSAYVVDTGINTTHADFGTRIAPGYSAIAGGVEDCNGHGTHVAGIIAGSEYGAAKAATIIPVRVLDCTGSGSYSSVIAGLDWIAANAPAGVPAVVNMSLGGGASSTVDTAVKNLIARGLSVVVAAGNSAADACTASPSRVAEAITVGATNNLDERAAYSNFGTCLDVFAPGSGITSAWIGSTTASSTISGTSMASPLVAGIVARFIADNPTLSPSQIASSLKSAATQNVLTQVGSGSLNLLAYLDFTSDGSAVTQPVDVPPTTSPGNSSGSKKPTGSPGKKK